MTFIKLYNDDCFNVLPNIENKSVDLVIVDLPFGQTNCSWDIKIDLNKMWSELKRICKDNTAYIFFTTTKFGIDLINSNKKWFRYDLVWLKTNSVGFLNANRMPLRSHEMIYIFYKKLPTYNPQMVDSVMYKRSKRGDSCSIYGAVENKAYCSDKRFPKSYINVINSNHKSLHPTQKNIKLLEWLIKTYSNEGDVVLDFTAGVMSTGLACKNTNRSFIGIEKEEGYFNKSLVSDD